MAFEIEVKKNGFSKATFYIDNTILKFGEKEIMIKDITGFAYMSTQNKVNGINTSKTFEIKIWKGEDKNPTNIFFMGAFGGGAANEKYLTVTDQLWTYFGDGLLKQLHRDLMDGKTVELASNIKLTSKGIVIRRKPLFKAAYEVLAPWNDIRVDAFQGMITIKCNSNKKARTTEHLNSKNIWVLYYYIDWLARTPDVTSTLLNVPNNYRLIDKV